MNYQQLMLNAFLSNVHKLAREFLQVNARSRVQVHVYMQIQIFMYINKTQKVTQTSDPQLQSIISSVAHAKPLKPNSILNQEYGEYGHKCCLNLFL